MTVARVRARGREAQGDNGSGHGGTGRHGRGRPSATVGRPRLGLAGLLVETTPGESESSRTKASAEILDKREICYRSNCAFRPPRRRREVVRGATALPARGWGRLGSSAPFGRVSFLFTPPALPQMFFLFFPPLRLTATFPPHSALQHRQRARAFSSFSSDTVAPQEDRTLL